MNENLIICDGAFGSSIGNHDIQDRESDSGKESCANGRFSDGYYSRSL